jgi:hypothetical protein
MTSPEPAVLEVRRLSEQAGGLRRFKELVDALAE